jgi:hypothetical protein
MQWRHATLPPHSLSLYFPPLSLASLSPLLASSARRLTCRLSLLVFTLRYISLRSSVRKLSLALVSPWSVSLVVLIRRFYSLVRSLVVDLSPGGSVSLGLVVEVGAEAWKNFPLFLGVRGFLREEGEPWSPILCFVVFGGTDLESLIAGDPLVAWLGRDRALVGRVPSLRGKRPSHPRSALKLRQSFCVECLTPSINTLIRRYTPLVRIEI